MSINRMGLCPKHKRPFNLEEGCPDCLAERRQRGITPELDELEDGLNKEGATLNLESTYQTEPEQALIKVKPDKDDNVIKIYEESCKILGYANSREIKTSEDVKEATNDLSIIARLKKAIEEKRKDYTQPINAHLKDVNSAFQSFTAPLIQADTITRRKITDYEREQERVRQEQERINDLRMEAARAEQQLKGELSESVDLVEVSEETPAHYRTESGTLGKVKKMRWKVVDQSLVPEEYKLIDSVKVNKIVNAGGTIPGIETWEEKTLRITTH